MEKALRRARTLDRDTEATAFLPPPPPAGYTSGDPAKRTPGAIMSSLSILVLLGTSLASAYNLVAGTGFNF